MSIPSQENSILMAMQNALIRKLEISTTQCEVADAAYFDPAWMDYPHFQVIPGDSSPEGGGTGAQEGGSLLRRMVITIRAYVRMKLDQHDQSEQLLLQPDSGVIDTFEAIRKVFEYTFLGTAGDLTSFLLYQPLQVAGESKTDWVDQDLGIVSREFRWNAFYGLTLPSSTTLTLSDVI